jgi:hypothetical protein
MLSLCAAGPLVSSRAMAQAGVPAAATTAPAPRSQSGSARPGSEALVAERQRLRAELTRVETEIDQLKKGERGLRTDYQLRGRLADAEAIARRLTELDRALRSGSAEATGGATRIGGPVGDEPTASPSDGPAELEAKADILADQAHRVQAQAVVLKARIDQVRERRELRRRAHQLDSDPFAPLEGSKRRLLTGSSSASRSGENAGQSSDSAHAPTVSGTQPPALPTAGTVTGLNGASPPPSTVTPSTPPSTPIPDGKGLAATPVQVHDLLDPATLAQVRKAGAGATSSSDLEAMEKALAALNARSQYLDAQSKLLRERAR